MRGSEAQRWNISCESVHPQAWRFVEDYAAGLLNTGIDRAGPLQERLPAISREAAALSDSTLKCHGIEPMARHTGVPFPSDFGELHELLRTAHEFLDSVIAGKHPVLRDHNRGEVRKRYEELKSGTGRRYRERA